jgi:tRNA nucleotidyltransferase (CCA-adding enzyme)
MAEEPGAGRAGEGRIAKPSLGGRDVLEALRAVPGGVELLSLAAARDDVAIVGGAVRDLLRRRAPRELDVVVASDAETFALELASHLGAPAAHDGGQSPSASVHERFGTAVVGWASGRLDIAERRAESYPAPGALPEVRPGSAEEDLRRRDFTVNAIAVALGGPRQGELQAVEHALEDLAGGRLRVLHERSFLDDPTRLLRLARYRARLGFELEERTAELAAEALDAGALATVSRARVGAELRLALAEPDPLAALAALSTLGVLSALDPQLRFEEELAADALAMLPEDGRRDLLLLAVLLLPVASGPGHDPEAAMFDLLDGLEFTAGDRERAIRTALLAPSLQHELRAARRPSEIREAVSSGMLEAVSLAGVLGGEGRGDRARNNAGEWLQRWRHVHLEITGDDLLAAGISAGPEIGRRLALALQRKLDGELDDGREAELRAALEAPL